MTTILNGSRRSLLIASSILVGAMATYPAQAAPAPDGATGVAAVTASAEGQSSASALAATPALAAELGNAALDPEEAGGLQFMIQEEKLAHDLYLAFHELWGLPVFERIASSEAAHEAALARLLVSYGLENPNAEAALGVFTDPDLQVLYDQLLADGSTSAGAALRAAVRVEETDIKDLQARLSATDEAAIQRVYTSLLRGSIRHLAAFSRQTDRLTESGLSAPPSGQPGIGQGGGGSGRGRWSR